MPPSSYTAREKAADVLADARRWILTGGLLGAAVGLIIGVAAPSHYEASATVLLRGTDDFVAFTTDGIGQWTAVYGRRPEYGTEEAALTSQDVLAAAADSLDLKEADESWNEAAERLGRSIRAERLQGRVARVTAADPSAERAADRANAVVEAYLGQHWSEQWPVVGREVAGRRGSRSLADALPPEERSGPGPFGILGLGILAGLLAGLVGGSAASLTSPRIRHPWQAAALSGRPVVEIGAGSRNGRWLLTRPSMEGDGPGSVLLMPVGAAVEPVAAALELARTARLQGLDAAVLDLSTRDEAEEVGPDPDRPKVAVYTLPPDSFTEPEERPVEARAEWLRERVAGLAEDHDLLLMAVPSPGSLESVALLEAGRPAALVAGAGLTEKREWSEAVRALRRLDVPTVEPIVYRPEGPPSLPEGPPS